MPSPRTHQPSWVWYRGGMGDLAEYIRALWQHGVASYSKAKAAMNAAIIGAGILGLLGLQTWVPAVPHWLAPAWLVGSVAFAVLVEWPFRTWKSQRDQIRGLIGQGHLTIR